MGRRFIKRHTPAEMIYSRFSPFLPCVSCDLRAVLNQIRRDRVPTPQEKISILFVVQEPLACIWHDQTTAEILLHNLLNTIETPTEVFRHILTHEMLHLVIPGRDIDGKHTRHPPEFFEQEVALAPERDESFDWIEINFGEFLKNDKKREGFIVKRGWHAIMDTPRTSLEQSNEIGRRLTVPTGTRKRLSTGHASAPDATRARRVNRKQAQTASQTQNPLEKRDWPRGPLNVLHTQENRGCPR